MKQAAVFVVLLLSGIAMRAQNEDIVKTGKKDKKIKPWFDIHAGLNYSGIEGETEEYKNYIPGFTAGMRMSVLRFGERFRINVEVNYSEQGGKYTIDNPDYPPGLPRTGILRLNYVNIPVTFRYQDKSGFYVEIGGQAGYLIHAEHQYNGNNTDVKNEHSKYDYDLLGGLGLRIIKHWGLGVRVVPGIKNINKYLPNFDFVHNDHNVVATALVSYNF